MVAIMAVSNSKIAITGWYCDGSPDTNVLSRRQIERIKNLTDEELTRTQDKGRCDLNFTAIV